MKTRDSITLSFTVIMVQDPKTDGYTAYFKQLPDIVTEGNTEDEAVHNLFNAVHDVFNYQNEINDVIMDKDLKVSKKSINFFAGEFA